MGPKKLMTDVHRGWSLGNRGKSTQRKQGGVEASRVRQSPKPIGLHFLSVCLFVLTLEQRALSRADGMVHVPRMGWALGVGPQMGENRNRTMQSFLKVLPDHVLEEEKSP